MKKNRSPKSRLLISASTAIAVATLIFYLNLNPPRQLSLDSWRSRSDIGAYQVVNYGWPQITVTTFQEGEEAPVTRTLVNRAALIPNVIALLVTVYIAYLFGNRIGSHLAPRNQNPQPVSLKRQSPA